MIGRSVLSIALSLATVASALAFAPAQSSPSTRAGHVIQRGEGSSSNAVAALRMAAESEVSFSELDGSTLRIGVLRTRWNDEYVSSLVDGIKEGAKECKVKEENIFIKEVPGAYELPYAAKLLAMSGTVDAIICAGVLIKGDTYHFEYISEAVAKGIMQVNLATNTPVIYGVLNCLDEAQVAKRSSNDNGGHNHGEDWGKTAVEMAIMRREAMGMMGGADSEKTKSLAAVGLGGGGSAPAPGVEKAKPGFF